MITRNAIAWGMVILIIFLGIFAIGLTIESAILEKNLRALKKLKSGEVKQGAENLRKTLSHEFKERYKDMTSLFEKRAEELAAEKKRVKELESR